MKKTIFTIIFIGLICFGVQAQRSNTKIAYVDTEYILENIPEYQEALQQLASKVEKWKKEIDLKIREIDKKKLDLRNESVLLTRELIEEREEEIQIEESAIFEYQQKRFGPEGDLFLQKKLLTQPIQDQVLIAVQEFAATKKYDFIYDRANGAVMLYANKKYDVSDFIVRTITRSAKKNKQKEDKENKTAEKKLDPKRQKIAEDRAKAKAEKLAERQRILDKRAKDKAERQRLHEEKRQKLLDEKANENSNTSETPKDETNN